MRTKPTLLAYLKGLPDVESVYPVLARLHQRNNVNARALVLSKVLRREKRLVQAFENEGFVPEIIPKWRMKLFFKNDIDSADAVLTISDPKWDMTTLRQRGKYMQKIGKQSIFLQHGAYQLGVNGAFTDGPMGYYSKRLLFWEPLGKNRELFETSTADKVKVVGFTKKNVIPQKSWGAEVDDWVARYPKRLLICQSFRWGKGRYSNDHISHFYNLMDSILTKHPDIGIVVRSHRGKVRKNHRSHDKALDDKHPNVLFSRYYSGPLAKASIHDALDLCHAMVSPTSTTVLDCIYSGKPAAVFAEDVEIFADLQQISDEATMEKFVSSLDENDPVYDKIRDRFGAFDDNLDRAAKAIEDHLLSERAR